MYALIALKRRFFLIYISKKIFKQSFSVSGLMKPGAKVEQITSNIVQECTKLNSEDFVALSAGANNVY